MLQRLKSGPKRVLMTIDAVGGVWRYAMDLASHFNGDIEFVFAGLGPQPSESQRDEAENLGELVWLDAQPDWLVEDLHELAGLADAIEALARDVDIIHLNAPSQAAGLKVSVPVVAVAHSCVPTWFSSVRGESCPSHWSWQHAVNLAGLQTADAIVAPSHSHARALQSCYGPMERLMIIHNGSGKPATQGKKRKTVLAAGRWWDEGKNAAVLDAAAPLLDWKIITAGATKGPNGAQVHLNNLNHLGSLPSSQMGELIAEAAIVVSPSIYEPFGLVPLEGARAGAALVLADIPTYRELWEGAALFAHPHDPEAFADAINRLSREAALRADLARKAQARSAVYSLEAQANAVEALYSNLVHQPVH